MVDKVDTLKHKYLARLLVVTLGALNGTAWANENPASCARLLPKPLADVLRSSHSQWKVLELSDLTEDDRQIWEKARGKVCPGVARGDFDGSRKPQYAVLLLYRKTPTTLRLVHAVQAGNRPYRLLTMDEGESSRPPVVHRQPPGKYYRAGDTKTAIDVRGDVIYLETIEAGATAFYFANGKLRKVLVSE
jgi:hypothetical protein